ncbi:MAG: TonB-dependent receptor [Gammaproteobacteria bacterium]|nr:TonB-dependent receptor [Gammaproteobacteria bacterium]
MHINRNLVVALSVAGLVLISHPAGAEALVEEVIVQGDASLRTRLGTAGSVGVVDDAALAEIRPNHIHESLVRIPGVWISRGSGAEHLTAIRSAVLTGAGACGEFLFLEDAIPIRPVGFCNINNLFEVNSEQASAIEVWRGPASAVLGGNALHGAINVLTPNPTTNRVSLEGGSNGYYQIRGELAGEFGDHTVGLSLHGSESDGYRDATGYGQQKMSFVHQTNLGAWQVRNTLNASNLNQETGAFVRGFEAYDDGDLKDTNPSPEAYRDAWSVRAASHWQNGAWQVSPYLRRSRMVFLQHFLPGQPTETNEQTSGGVMATFNLEGERLSGVAGGQLEFMQGSLKEFQEAPTTGSAFLVATRPQGLHYDYDVDSRMAAAYYDVRWAFDDGTRLLHSLRVERLEYDYDNNHLIGNTRDDGTTCGFGGCLYTRPASRDDDFTEVAGRLGIEHDFGDSTGYLMFATGFRPPQITELYRLQNGQSVPDIESERLLSFEAGLKDDHWSVAVFSERTEHFILRDADGFNVSDAKTKAIGVEFALEWGIDDHSFGLAGTYAVHEYDFDRMAALGEVIENGNMIDSAPRWIGNARWRYQPGEAWYSEVEINYLAKYYLNAANTAEYDGHFVVNWRGGYQINDRVHVFARVINLLDERYADRADFAFGSYRYFPAMPIQGYLGVSLTL